MERGPGGLQRCDDALSYSNINQIVHRWFKFPLNPSSNQIIYGKIEVNGMEWEDILTQVPHLMVFFYHHSLLLHLNG